MKKDIKMFLAFTVCALMLFAGMTVSSVGVSAAVKTDGTIDLQKKALIIPKGKKTAIKGSTLTMVKNRRYQIKAKFGSTTVSKTGTYKSSKPAVATVSSTGLVTAKAPGTTTIKVTYKGKTQSFKVKVIASHSHAWKTTKKATCETKGKKLCQTCGVTGTTAKTAHKYITETCETLEGRGKASTIDETNCGGCGANMTDWSEEQIRTHRTNFDNFQCFGACINHTLGVTKYEKYFMVKNTSTYCKNCGAWDMKRTYDEDLYECDGFGNRLTSSATTATVGTVVATQSSKGANIVLEDTESDVILADDSIAGDTDIADSEEVSTDAPVISDNAVVSDNMIETE